MAGSTNQAILEFIARDEASGPINNIVRSMQAIQPAALQMEKASESAMQRTRRAFETPFDDTVIKGRLDSVSAKINELPTTAEAAVEKTNASFQEAGKGLSFLKQALSMTVGMIGYDLVNSVMESTRAAINANQEIEYFGNRLHMSSGQIKDFRSELDQMQGQFLKVNMDQVGATALDIVNKNHLAVSSINEVVQTTAVMSSAFVREGRTETDAILAVSDAIDGQFRRLQEIGIQREDIMKQGWNGDLQDTDGLLKALNKTMEDMGFTTTAGDITNLDDAWQYLNVTLSKAGASIIDIVTPAILGLIKGLGGIIEFVQKHPEAQIILLTSALTGMGIAINGLLIPAMKEFIASTVPAWLESITSLIAGTTVAEGSFGGLAAAIVGVEIAGAPLWAVVAAITAIGIALFEGGKQLGWWTDLASMGQAVWAGLTDIWNTFVDAFNTGAGEVGDGGEAINQILSAMAYIIGGIGQVLLFLFTNVAIPYLKVVISIMGTVVGLLARVFNWIGVQLGGALKTLKTIATSAWNAFKSGVMAVISPLQKVYNFVKGIVDGIKKFAGKTFTVSGAAGEPKVTGRGGEILPQGNVLGLAQNATQTPVNNNNQQAVQFNISEGAINLKLDDVTEDKASGIMVKALEGLQSIQSVNLKRTVI